jgi:hypothetical protein
MEDPDSPPRPRRRRPPRQERGRIELLQEPDDEEAAALKPAARNQSVTTIHRLPDDLLRISFAFLLGNGHFRYHGIACKMLLKASEQQPGHRKITTAESVTYSIECAQ